ncbi:uncharacterized protein TNCV_1954151 [Trichonephila clavipes]|nr:uncharacterized protein TNCV_1954151 [Trichonephila clavipes]
MEGGKRLTIIVDQVRIYRHRKCDETEIRTGSLRDESSGFDRVQWRSNESEDGKKKGSGGPERKVQKGSEHRVPKRNLSSNDTNSVFPKNKEKPKGRDSSSHHKRLQP